MKIWKQRHIKFFLIMELNVENDTNYISDKIYLEKADERIKTIKSKQAWHRLEKCEKKNNRVLMLKNNVKDVVGYCVVAEKGHLGDLFKVRECNQYISNIYIFPNYRNMGYAKELLKVITKTSGRYRLCVRTNNFCAMNSYHNAGFKVIDYKIVFDVYEDICFPKYKI